MSAAWAAASLNDIFCMLARMDATQCGSQILEIGPQSRRPIDVLEIGKAFAKGRHEPLLHGSLPHENEDGALEPGCEVGHRFEGSTGCGIEF
jgi:hypothetical protein